MRFSLLPGCTRDGLSTYWISPRTGNTCQSAECYWHFHYNTTRSEAQVLSAVLCRRPATVQQSVYLAGAVQQAGVCPCSSPVGIYASPFSLPCCAQGQGMVRYRCPGRIQDSLCCLVSAGRTPAFGGGRMHQDIAATSPAIRRHIAHPPDCGTKADNTEFGAYARGPHHPAQPPDTARSGMNSRTSRGDELHRRVKAETSNLEVG
jgi:hypothetical protein